MISGITGGVEISLEKMPGSVSVSGLQLKDLEMEKVLSCLSSRSYLSSPHQTRFEASYKDPVPMP